MLTCSDADIGKHFIDLVDFVQQRIDHVWLLILSFFFVIVVGIRLWLTQEVLTIILDRVRVNLVCDVSHMLYLNGVEARMNLRNGRRVEDNVIVDFAFALEGYFFMTNGLFFLNAFFLHLLWLALSNKKHQFFGFCCAYRLLVSLSVSTLVKRCCDGSGHLLLVGLALRGLLRGSWSFFFYCFLFGFFWAFSSKKLVEEAFFLGCGWLLFFILGTGLTSSRCIRLTRLSIFLSDLWCHLVFFFEWLQWLRLLIIIYAPRHGWFFWCRLRTRTCWNTRVRLLYLQIC